MKLVRAIAIILLFTLISCTAGRQGGSVDDEQQSESGKVTADAYLFDAKIHRNGKPTTIRLELYVVADTVYIHGRAYLGKGALRARLTPDSIVALFPTEREYVADRVTEVISSENCEDKLVRALNLAELLTDAPGDNSPLTEILVENDKSRSTTSQKKSILKKKRSFGVTTQCKWSLQLDYDQRAKRQHLVHLLFDDGRETRINASLREVKIASRVPKKRLTLTIPSNYSRLSDR